MERELLTGAVALAPPSSTDIANVRGRAALLSPATLDLREVDVVFLALHGGAGEDGRIQAMLDLAGITYTGSNHIASATAMDKDLSKRLFRGAGVPTADWLMAPVSPDQVAEALAWPVVVKPNKQGSTVGLSVVRDPHRLAAAVDRAGQFGPPRSSRPTCRNTSQSSCKSTRFARMQRSSYSRIDFRQDAAGAFWCLEANSLPGMTATSLLPQAAKAAGIGFPDLLERICTNAVRSL